MRILLYILGLMVLLFGCQGQDGSQGPPGSNGYASLIWFVPGNDTNCPFGGTLVLQGLDTNSDGVLEVNEVQQYMDVCSGSTGSSASLTPTIAITPCGPNSSSYKEALLGLFGGGIFGSFSKSSDATTVRDTLLPDGSYYDTDDSECNFTVSTDGSGNRTISWDGSSANGSGPYNPGNAKYSVSTKAWTVIGY